jgi:hypothetical protein
MKTNPTKKGYQKPQVAQIKIDTEIALVMVSVPPNPMMPQMPEGWVQKIFK